MTVEQRTIGGEQFDVLIHDHQHVLVEIAASVGRSIGPRLERKRRLYEESTGVADADGSGRLDPQPAGGGTSSGRDRSDRA